MFKKRGFFDKAGRKFDKNLSKELGLTDGAKVSHALNPDSENHKEAVKQLKGIESSQGTAAEVARVAEEQKVAEAPVIENVTTTPTSSEAKEEAIKEPEVAQTADVTEVNLTEVNLTETKETEKTRIEQSAEELIEKNPSIVEHGSLSVGEKVILAHIIFNGDELNKLIDLIMYKTDNDPDYSFLIQELFHLNLKSYNSFPQSTSEALPGKISKWGNTLSKKEHLNSGDTIMLSRMEPRDMDQIIDYIIEKTDEIFDHSEMIGEIWNLSHPDGC